MKKEVDININIVVQDYRKNQEVNSIQATSIPTNSPKLKSNISVSQIALFCRLMHDLEAISVKNQTDILKFIASNFYTDNAQEISTRSLRSKYYSVDIATKEAVKLMLNKMVVAIDRY